MERLRGLESSKLEGKKFGPERPTLGRETRPPKLECPLYEVASEREQAGAWYSVASKRGVRRVLRPEIVCSSNHSTHGRQENAQLACHAVPGEAGRNKFSRVEPLSSSTRSGSPIYVSAVVPSRVGDLDLLLRGLLRVR